MLGYSWSLLVAKALSKEDVVKVRSRLEVRQRDLKKAGTGDDRKAQNDGILFRVVVLGSFFRLSKKWYFFVTRHFSDYA